MVFPFMIRFKKNLGEGEIDWVEDNARYHYTKANRAHRRSVDFLENSGLLNPDRP
jgi:hypothetical protein